MRNLSIRKMNGLLKGKKSGFTLVELIIVIAIIAILAAIAIPKFGEIRTSANQKADIATAKNIATVVAAGIADNKISATQAAHTAITALKAAKTGDADVNITGQIDGSTTPKNDPTNNTAFTVTVTDGNIDVFYDTDTNPIYPE